ncbi:MAG: acyl-homoserine-lactone synthase [Patescibacteria group bacterium]
MKTIYQLQVKIGDKDKIINFGIPDNPDEIEKMYRLRFNIYSYKKYIDPKLFPDGIEKDEYDFKNKCTYFIAKLDDKVLGTVRLIKDEYLPTEKECFKFDEPEEMKKIPRNQRVELGRLVIIPPDKDRKIYLPRNLIMLFLINTLVTWGIENNIPAGYAFIKEKLKIKLNKLKAPIHLIKNYTQIYPKDGIIYGYFNQEDDKAIPIYFLTQEFKNFIDGKSNMFKKEGSKFILRENLYNKFLRLMKII